MKVTAVEVKQVDLPDEMRRAMAKQAEAERERRAKIIAAEGEFQAAEKLGKAADVIARSPGALQLRYLQTLVEISAEKNSAIMFPLPIELVKPFIEAARLSRAARRSNGARPRGGAAPSQSGDDLPSAVVHARAITGVLCANPAHAVRSQDDDAPLALHAVAERRRRPPGRHPAAPRRPRRDPRHGARA